ncbi:hypothetical protein K439DRAFT_1627798, partial [Ramaria rubella]
MPHCGQELYESVLRENWGVDGVKRLLLLGNLLHEYTTVIPKWKLEQCTPCISRIWKHLKCASISSLDRYPFAFNNLGLQYTNLDTLPSQEDPMWCLPPPMTEHSKEL